VVGSRRRWALALALAVVGCAEAAKQSEDLMAVAVPRDLATVADPRDLATATDLSVSTPVDLAPLVDLAPSCVDSGITCATGNPGACATGHMTCNSAGPICVPDVTTQSCYSGPNGTAGKGICKAGTQTCIGALGRCVGEVTPAAQEDCFTDVDDNCDGRVNEGCPDHLVVGTTLTLTPQRGGAGGNGPYSLRCPDGAVVTKMRVYFEATYVLGASIWCGTPRLVKGASTWSVALDPVAGTQPDGSNASLTGSNTPLSATDYVTCQDAAVANELAGSEWNNYMEGLGMACSTLTVALGSDGAGALGFGGDATSTPRLYVIPPQYGVTFYDPCPTGQVIVGLDLRLAAWMDSARAACTTLALVNR
jgi:hypothetical protein